MNNGHTIELPPHGYVRLIDSLGTDSRIVEAARVSYGRRSKGDEADKKLLHYLYKNRHCYHPKMQVLTADGWKKWADCNPVETYMVPDNGVLRREDCKTVSFQVSDEPMCTFANNRMSYSVTADHRMLFRNRNGDAFKIVRAGEMRKWGHFKAMSEYAIEDAKAERCPLLSFVGFFLGDGCGASKNSVCFHFRKRRKIQYLRMLCSALNIGVNERQSGTHADGVVISVRLPDGFSTYADHMRRGEYKELSVPLSALNANQIAGLFDGLVNSDGSIKKDRPQIEFSSSSRRLADLFQNAASMLGMDAHFCKCNSGVFSVKAYHRSGRTSLEARKQYFRRARHSGLVYCATTSTGLLVVRGAEDEFGFICGNTSPFEQCSITFNIKFPIFLMRQFVRHRTFRLNEWSGRYSELDDEFFLPEKWRTQDAKNKQGSNDPVDERLQAPWQHRQMIQAKRVYDIAYVTYREMLADGVAKEQARFVLPVGIYTEIYVNCDLHNLLHFLRLREDAHAQKEMRDVAVAMKAIAQELFPWSFEAYERYRVVIEDTTAKVRPQQG